MVGILAVGESSTVRRAHFKTIGCEVQENAGPNPHQMESTAGMSPTSFSDIMADTEQGLVPLPKSVRPERIEENADVYGFDIDKEDMEALETDEYSPCTWDPTTEPL